MQKVILFLSEPMVGTLLGVTGVALAVYFYFKSRQVSRISHYLEEVAVIGSATAAFHDNLEIRFGGELVKRVTKSRAYLWNSGNTTIDGERITKPDPLRIENGPGNEILKVELLRQSRNVSNVIFEIKDKNSVEVSFDFFDPNDGFVVEIVHTGSRRSLYWKGTVRGIPEGISDSGGSTLLVSLSGDIFAKVVGKSTKFVMMIAALLGLAIAMLGLFREKFKEYDDILNWPSNDYPGPSWPMVFMGIIYAILPIIMMWMRRRRFPRSLEIEQVTTDRNLAVDQGTQ